MLTKRIIPCLDIKDGRTVKGVNFNTLVDAGDPVALAEYYTKEGADEVVFLDISATQENRRTLVELVKTVATQLNIPFTVGGGINAIENVGALLDAGADKISINSAAVKDPSLIDSLAKLFGSQFVVVAIDATKIDNQWLVYTHGGSVSTEKKLFSWAKEVENRGAGEILFTSIDNDGTRSGFAIEPLTKLNELLTIPIIASGGAGTLDHFIEVFKITKSSAAIAASIFHYKETSIDSVKQHLNNHQIPVRL